MVLGPCVVLRAGTEVPAPPNLSVTQRRLLARLAMAAPEAVTLGQLADAVWEDEPPRTARAALNNQISRVRSLVGADVIRTTPSGYVLAVPTDSADVHLDVAAAEQALTAGDATSAFGCSDAVLARFRGTPLSDLEHLVDAEPVRQRLKQLRAGAETIRLTAALRLGRVAWAVPEAERLVAEAGLDEQRWALLVEALDLAGRRGDALGAVDLARHALRDNLGLEPGPRLRAAEAAALGVAAAERPALPTRLIGRDGELSALSGAAERGERAVVRGEDGSGKSGLLDELARRQRRAGALVAHTRCLANPATPVSVLVELLADLGQKVDRAIGPVEGFVAAVGRAAATSRVVLVVDDLHLAGPSSWAGLTEAAAVDGVALIAAVNDPDPGAGDGTDDTVVVLAPLTRPAVAELASDVLGLQLDESDPVVEWLGEMSGGNLLFLVCLLEEQAVAHVSAPGSNADLDHVAPGTSVLGDLVRRRIERLGATTHGTIEVAAVCGPECPTSLLDQLVPATGLAAAISAGLLISDNDGHTRFRHGAVQRTVYVDVPPGRRMELHYAAGLRLRGAAGPAGTVAHHLLAAMELDPGAAADVAREAAGEATSHAAHRDAARWYERSAHAARAIGPHGDRRLVLALIGEGDSLRLAGDAEQEQVLFDAVDLAESVGDADLIGEAACALLQLGVTTESGSLQQRTVDVAERALNVVDDAEQRATIAAAASLAYSMSGHPDRCRELFLQAEVDAVSSHVRRRVLPYAFLGIGLPQDLDSRDQLTEELLDLSREADDPVARFEGCHLSFSIGLQRADGPRVRRALAEMVELIDRVGDIGRRWAIVYQNAAVAHLDDDLVRSERLAEDAMDLFAPVSPSRSFAVFGSQLLVLRLAQGRVAELADVTAGLVSDQPGVPAWHAAHALTMAEADPAVARHHARAALEDVPRDFTWLAGHVIGARAAARVGDRATVAEYTRRLQPWSGLVCWQGTCAYGPVDTPLAALALAAGDHEAAALHVVEARRLARALQAPVFERELDGLLPPD